MTNTTQIRAYIESQGLKLGHVARVLGISSSALHQKLNDESDFKVSEADRLSAMLGLTMEQRDACFFGPGTQTLGKVMQTVLLPCLYGDSSFCAELGEDAPAKRNGVLLRAAGQGHPNAEVSAEYVAGLGRLSVSQIGLHPVAFAADLHFCPDALAIQPRHAVGLGRQYDRQGLFIQGKQRLIIGPL